eukprot:TRINITY_DN10077_c2_g1_i1.p1 TRINITY_DN10077_c2_g1~~TRINITY_DN10077_c2_g1_i1.p1  ORF type:complete len:810 (+),score=262.36 TRINITY_DN10077_c2_g1_i1:144-2432(+)
MDVAGAARAAAAPPRRWRTPAAFGGAVGGAAEPSADECWRTIQRGIDIVFHGRRNHRLPKEERPPASLSYEEVYRQVVTLTERRDGEWLYGQIRAAFDAAAEAAKQDGCSCAAAHAGLAKLVDVMEDFELFGRKVRDLCSYLEVNWSARRGLPGLQAVSRESFAGVLLSSEFGASLQSLLLAEVDTLVGGGNVSRSDLRRAVSLSTRLRDDHYAAFLQTPIARRYRTSLQRVRSDLLSAAPGVDSAVRYVQRVCAEVRNLRVLSESADLPEATCSLLSGVHLDEMVEDATAWAFILDSVPELCKAATPDSLDAVSQLYSLCGRVGLGQQDEVLQSVVCTLREEGVRAVDGAADDTAEYVSCLLEFDARVVRVQQQGGLTDDHAAGYFASLCTAVYNHSDRVVEGVVNWIDSVIRKEGGRMEEDAVDTLWDPLASILGRVKAKDTLTAMLQVKLARRLLTLQYPVDPDGRPVVEVALLARLKRVLGPGNGDRARVQEEMLRDIGVSSELHAAAEASTGRKSSLRALVLTSNSWVSFSPSSINLPDDLRSEVAAFESYYHSRHSGRKLAWYPSLGKVWLVAHLKRGRKELQVTLTQAAVLLVCFNAADSATAADAAACAADEEGEREVCKALSSLVSHKLIRAPDGFNPRTSPDPAAVFVLNASYTSKHSKVSMCSSKSTAVEADKARKEVSASRAQALEAAVVRVMKSRRVLRMNELVELVVAQVRPMFTPDVPSMKRRVEALIDRGYLERDEDDGAVLKYLT